MKPHPAALLLCTAFAACTLAEPPVAAGVAAAAPCAGAADTATGPGAADVWALRQSIEHSPLYAAAAAGTGVAACTVASAGAGQLRFDYRFVSGNTLQVVRDPRIELLQQGAQFVSPLAQPALALLGEAERAAYGAGGCGIDWALPDEARPAPATPGSTETVYRGEACNCQAIVRRDAGGRITALTLKSAC
jgi:hypothetical protein